MHSFILPFFTPVPFVLLKRSAAHKMLLYIFFLQTSILLALRRQTEWTDPVFVADEFSKQENILSAWKLMVWKVSRISRWNRLFK